MPNNADKTRLNPDMTWTINTDEYMLKKEFYKKIDLFEKQLGRLNTNLEQSNAESNKLSKSIKLVTIVGVIVSTFAFIIPFLFDVYKYYKGIK